MEQKKTSLPYRLIKAGVRLVYPRIQAEGTEHLPEGAAVIVGNHCQMNGPIAAELYCPGAHYTWCAGQMMKLKEVPGYAFQDFWSQKPGYTHWYYRLASYLIAPLSVCVFNNANTIAVWRDSRIVGTFKNTVKRLEEGARVVIFPEHDVKYNHIVYEFQDHFVDVARLYYKKTGKALPFVPVYIAPRLHKMVFGPPVYFDPAAPMDLERQRIRQYLMDTITAMARSLPEHTVVPYRNIPRRYYPTNTCQEGPHENTRG